MNLPSVDGPHTPNTTAATAAILAEAVRVLNHATLPNRAADTLPYPSDVARLLGHLGTALERLPQLLRQLDGCLAGMVALPLETIDGTPPQQAINAAGTELRWAADLAGDVGNTVRNARAHVDRVGVKG